MDRSPGEFYIGVDPTTTEPIVYKADTLTTHGVIFGMTGSGKTGLGVNLLEEALLDGVPTLVLDPKGDMGNLMLAFPDSSPADYRPWMDPAKAERKGMSIDDLATKEALERPAELEEHHIGPERVRQFADSVDTTIYTPGSNAGVGINILGSLDAPNLDWDTHGEIIRDEIEGLVSSILTLAGITSDPVSGPEHILLATIIETHWKAGKDLDLATLVGQIPQPPFRKLGVFDIDTFMPTKKRMDLALKLNALLASPSFANWLHGSPLDIEEMLRGSDKTKCAVIYMAHLSDEERQFVVTLILSKLVTWIRSQPGSSELRALIYMDEAFGYAPPTAEPPSKKPIMTILKQARAFGVGLVLVTQNPVDLDYKAMSNAGTWIVGRLQTENDKKRILEGIPTAALDLDTTISTLERRHFVMHLAKKGEQTILRRRRSMCFRYGPFTRDQVSQLMSDRKPALEQASPEPELDFMPTEPMEETPVVPVVAEGVEVVFADPGATWLESIGGTPTGGSLVPAAAVTVQLLYDETKADLQHSETYEAIIYPLDGVVDPADVVAVDHDDRDFVHAVNGEHRYRADGIKLANKTFWSGLSTGIKNHLVAHRSVEIFQNKALRLYSRIDETEPEFVERCTRAAEQEAEAKIAKLTATYETRIGKVKDQIVTADARVRELEGDAAAKSQDEVMSGAGDLLGALFGGRGSSNPLGKAASRRAATQKARARADAAGAKLEAKQTQLVELEAELADKIDEISDKADTEAAQVEPMQVGLEKSDVTVAEAKLVWVPVD